MSLYRDHYSVLFNSKLKRNRIIPKCCFPYWTICRLACCQIKLHTALVNLISNLMAEPQPDKVRVASDGNCSETIVSSGDTLSCRYLFFFLVARGIPDCLGRSRFLLKSKQHFQESPPYRTVKHAFLKAACKRTPKRKNGYTCASINGPESKLIN